MGQIKIHKEILQKLINEGLKDSEIAEKLGFKTISIYFARKRYKINRIPYNLAKNIQLTEKQKEFIVGCVLGDGNLSLKRGSINPNFSCEHGEKQSEYVKYKFNILEGLNPFYRDSIRNIPDKRNNKYYKSSKVRLNANPELLWFYNQFYQPKKIITKKLLQYYTPFAMAIHYMDDGYTSANSYYIATNCFDNNSLKIFQDFLLEKYNIKTSLHKGNKLYILKESSEIFTKLIKPYFIESMNYKLRNY